ncbi:MAG: helix-turn-helix domain-containing protein [Bacteroidetes bacterium]|nr:helix-turn-helix domain-containing protein [Bacteroidota bacterium]
MPDKNKIYNLDLIYDDTPMPFVIKTMEEIDKQLGGIADNPHRHNYYTVIWSLKATGKHIIDFREYPILPNHVFFVSPGQVHQIITDVNPTGYVILFTSEFLERNSIRKDFISNLKLFKSSDETPPLPLTDKMADTLKPFTDKMLTAFHSKTDMFFDIIGAYLKLFLIECNGQCSLFRDSNTQTIEVGKTLVNNFKTLVEKNYSRWHQVKYYADTLNVTPNYLNEVIRSTIKISAKDYIQNRLILEAKRMVIFTERSGKEIGFELGFEDPSHFSKFFKTNTGQPLQNFKDTIAQ